MLLNRSLFVMTPADQLEKKVIGTLFGPCVFKIKTKIHLLSYTIGHHHWAARESG